MDLNRKTRVTVCSHDLVWARALRRALADCVVELVEPENLADADWPADVMVLHGKAADGSVVARAPAPALVVGTGQPEAMVAAVEAGARGYLDDEAPLDEIVAAVATVAGGGAVVAPPLLGSLLRHLVNRRRREEIAATLYISAETVRTHLENIYRKLGVHSQPELVAMAAKLGLLGLLGLEGDTDRGEE